jgi:hypothetical protein
MDSRALTIETAGRASDPTDKGSLNKNSEEKQRSPGAFSAGSPDTSAKNSDGGDSSPSLPANSGISTLGSLLQSKIDPYYGLENTAATHPKMIQFLHGNAGPLTSAMLHPSFDHYNVRHEMDDDGDESEEEGAVGGSLEFSDSTTT